MLDSYERNQMLRRRLAERRREIDWLEGEETEASSSLGDRPSLGSGAAPRILSEMSKEAIREKVRSALAASRGVPRAARSEETDLALRPEMMEFGVEAVMDAEARSREEDERISRPDPAFGGVKRKSHAEWMDERARAQDEKKKAADQLREAMGASAERAWTRQDIAATLQYSERELDYIVADDADWERLKKIAMAGVRAEPEMGSPRAHPHEDAHLERFPDVNVVQETSRPERRKKSDGKRFDGPVGADIGGAGVPIHKLITNKARRKKLTAYLKKLDLDMQDAYEAQNDGREPPRPRCTKPFVILPEHCAGWAHGHYFDTSDPQRCVRIDDSDVDRASVNVDFFETELGKDTFPDQDLLFSLRYGCRLKSKLPWSVVIAPPQLNARKHMREVANGVAEELGEEWMFEFMYVPRVPFQVEPFGAVAKKFSTKYRRTTNKSPDKSHAFLREHGLSVNMNIDLEADFPELKLTKVKQLREAAEILHAAWRWIVHERRRNGRADDLEEFLAPCAALSDLSAYFRRLVMSAVDEHNQGMYFKAAEEHQGKFLLDKMLQFGSSVGPNYGQRLADAVCAIFSARMDEWEATVRVEATRKLNPDPTAQKLCPSEYLRWLENRSRMEDSLDFPRSYFRSQYIDDFSILALSRLRCLKGLLLFWRICEDAKLPVSFEKTELGSLCTLLGVDFYMRSGIIKMPQQKLDLYKDWGERIAHMGKSIEHSELESIVGTLGFGTVAIPRAKPLMSRLYGVIHSKLGRWGKYALLSDLTKTDILRVIAEFEKNDGSPFVDGDELWLNPTSMLHVSWSDASRSPDDDSFSGIGAYCSLSGLAWFYEWDAEEAKKIKIHVGEMLAQVTNELLNKDVFAHSRILELVDNRGIVYVSHSARTRDPRLKLLSLLRRQILESANIRAQTRWLSTHKNVLGDTLSRGKFDEFIREIERRNLYLEKIVNLRECMPKDFKLLLRTLMDLTEDPCSPVDVVREAAEQT